MIDFELPQCVHCGSTRIIEDNRSGESTCKDCGMICIDRLVSTEAPYRVFKDDAESMNKIHHGELYNPFLEYQLTEVTKLQRDEKEFLWDGQRNIDDILYRLFSGEMNYAVKERAKELFQLSFRLQTAQKKGLKPMNKSSAESKDGKRQRYSRRKQFVVACIYQALKENGIPVSLSSTSKEKENGIKRWTIKDISDCLDGIDVSEYSVRHCLKDLGIELKA